VGLKTRPAVDQLLFFLHRHGHQFGVRRRLTGFMNKPRSRSLGSLETSRETLNRCTDRCLHGFAERPRGGCHGTARRPWIRWRRGCNVRPGRAPSATRPLTVARGWSESVPGSTAMGRGHHNWGQARRTIIDFLALALAREFNQASSEAGQSGAGGVIADAWVKCFQAAINGSRLDSMSNEVD